MLKKFLPTQKFAVNLVDKFATVCVALSKRDSLYYSMWSHPQCGGGTGNSLIESLICFSREDDTLLSRAIILIK